MNKAEFLLNKFSPGSTGAVEVKLGKNRTEADMRRYTDERDRLEREREEVRSSLASLKKERREAKEELGSCQGITCSSPAAAGDGDDERGR